MVRYLGFNVLFSLFPRLLNSRLLVIGGICGIVLYVLLILAILAHGSANQHDEVADPEVEVETGEASLFVTRVIRDVSDPGAAFNWDTVFE